MGATKKSQKQVVMTKKNCKSVVKKSANKSKITGKSIVIVNNNKSSRNKKTRRKNYSSETLQQAIKALDTGISLRKAANAYGVPVATLARRKNNPDVIKTKTGPPTVLSDAEEDDIVNWILYRANRGYPVTKTELLDCVQKYILTLKKQTPFINNRPSRHWYEGFRKRHPNLSIRTPQHLSLSRAGVTREDLKEWFDEQEKYLTSKNLLNISPQRVFNCDETNILLCPNSEKVLTEKGSRSVYKVTDGGKESLTALFMYSAAGTRAPPMLMFAYKGDLPEKIVKNTPKSWGIGVSESGWMTSESFYEYITTVFYPWLLQEKTDFPVTIYLNNHSSHITIPLVKFCREKQIEIIGLYPNSTHILQPLDIAFFHPFKEMWKKIVAKWKIQNNTVRLRKEDSPVVLKMTLDNMKEEKNIIESGFKGSGLVPFDFNAVDYDILQKRKKRKCSSIQQNVENVTENKRLHLQNFEKNISAELLQDFNNALSHGSWTGSIELKGLYEY